MSARIAYSFRPKIRFFGRNEWILDERLKIRGVRRIFFYCNRDGLFAIDPVKGIDDKESGYDDSGERKELEKVADMLFG